MKYSYTWLQSHIEESLPKPEVLKEKIIFHAFEVEDTEQVGDDTIFDIKTLPDRNGDCLSHEGMAREIAGLLGLTLKKTEHTLPEIPLLLPVEVKSELVRRYMTVRLDGVKVSPSPEWLKNALESVGQRSINNIVDATNFILLDKGQPTHAFDASKVDGGIVVRDAKENEKIITLSGEEKILQPGNLVIADYVGALGIAGVKGGKSAEISMVASESDTSVGPRVGSAGSPQPDTTEVSASSAPTTSILLEIANFDPASVRKTARALGLPTDAAKRFENNLSPEIVYQSAAQLVTLIKDIAGGEVTGVSDIYPHKPEMRTLSFAVTDIARSLGKADADAIANVFDHYHYEYKRDGDNFTLTIPAWRADITGVHDIVEEVGRVIGYDTIAPAPLPTVFPVAHSPIYQNIRAAKAWLVHDGYREVMTYTFRPKGEVEVARGAKGKSMLRTNLSDGLKESYDLNRLNAPLLGLSEIKLFEIGTVFPKADLEEIHLAIADKDGIKEMTVEEYIAEHKVVAESATLEIEHTASTFKPWSVYPYITRDIAVWIDGEDGKAKLETIVNDFANKYCVRAPVLFDEFTKDGKTSRAYRFVFQSDTKTLTEAEVEEWMKILHAEIEKDSAYTLR